MAPSVRLTADELDQVLAFIEERGAPFAFPQLPEFAAIRSSCNEKVCPALKATELPSRDPHACMRATAKKQRALIRSVYLLDPIHTIVRTGFAFRLSPVVYSRRASYQRLSRTTSGRTSPRPIWPFVPMEVYAAHTRWRHR